MSEIQVGQINSTDGSTAITTGAGGTVTLSAALTGTDATLSGGVYLGGTGSANYLDDYEEGTWTPSAETGITINSTYETATYTKVGRLVIIDINVSVDVTANNDAAFGNLPFVPNEDNMVCMLMINNDSATYPNRIRVKSNSTVYWKPQETLSGVQCTVKAIYKTTS